MTHADLVDGIGGVFWRAKDPHALATWYSDHFGIPDVHAGNPPWMQPAGPTVFSAFPADTDYFADDAQHHMINFRIRDLNAFCDAMKQAGHPEIKERETMDGIGRFAWINDPEGHRIELWEPA